MALSDAERTEAMRELVSRIFVRPARTATMNTSDLKAAVVAIDNFFDQAGSSIGSQTTILQHLLAALPEPFASDSTQAEKAVALSVWALKKAGVI